jgi:hypothetical protein
MTGNPNPVIAIALLLAICLTGTRLTLASNDTMKPKACPGWSP